MKAGTEWEENVSAVLRTPVNSPNDIIILALSAFDLWLLQNGL